MRVLIGLMLLWGSIVGLRFGSSLARRSGESTEGSLASTAKLICGRLRSPKRETRLSRPSSVFVRIPVDFSLQQICIDFLQKFDRNPPRCASTPSRRS